jgi:hypothetical protein
VPLLTHLTSCTLTKYDLFLANSLAAAVPWPQQPLYIPCTKSHVRFSMLRLYQKTSVGPRQVYPFRKKGSFYGEELSPRPTPSWRTTPCRLPATAYSIFLHLLSILEAVPPSPTWGSAMGWWQEPTYRMCVCVCVYIYIVWIKLYTYTKIY